MKKYLLLALVLCACSSKVQKIEVSSHDGQDGKNGHSIVSALAQATELECANGGSRLDMYVDLNDNYGADEGDLFLYGLAVCNGQDGAQGEQGVQGEQGPQGVAGPAGTDGHGGANGIPGNNGHDGSDGTSCSVTQVSGGAQITCGSSTAFVANGTNGSNGSSSGSNVTVTEYTSSVCTLITGTTSYVEISNNNRYLFTASSCASNTKFATVSQGESYWVSSNQLAVYSTNGVRVINYGAN